MLRMKQPSFICLIVIIVLSCSRLRVTAETAAMQNSSLEDCQVYSKVIVVKKTDGTCEGQDAASKKKTK